ncbi:MAG: ATP-binding protein [Fibrobacter sp.]|nr:ATP-binding protein [Fibrobacter sp.]
MKIKSLEIENFRGIKYLNLDLTGSNGSPLDMVVLAGQNGCGKTSILESIVILMGRDELLPKRVERNFNEVSFGANLCTLKGAIDAGGDWNISRPIFPGKDPKKTQKVQGLIEYVPSWRTPKLVGSVSVSVNGGSAKDDRYMENKLANLKQTIVDLTASQAFETSAAAPQIRGERELIIDKLNSVWKMFFPDRDEYFIPDAAPHAIGRRFDLFLKGRGSSLIPVDSLSSGEIEIISLIGRIARNATADYIMLIDEPELHLHPAWHRIILKALREVTSGAQIIVATHSPQIIGSIETANVRFLRKEGEKTFIEKATSTYGLDTNRVLEELMGVDERLPEIKDRLHDVFVLIADGNIKDARKKIADLRTILPEEPELTRAEAIISRKEILGK